MALSIGPSISGTIKATVAVHFNRQALHVPGAADRLHVCVLYEVPLGREELGYPAPAGLPNVSGCARRRIVWMNAESICSTLADEASEKSNG